MTEREFHPHVEIKDWFGDEDLARTWSEEPELEVLEELRACARRFAHEPPLAETHPLEDSPRLFACLCRLSEMERTLVCLRAGLFAPPMSLRGIAGPLGLTEQTVAAIERDALYRLRKFAVEDDAGAAS